MRYRVYLRGPEKIIVVDVKSDTGPQKGDIPGEESMETAITFGNGCWFRRAEVVAVVPHEQLQ